LYHLRYLAAYRVSNDHAQQPGGSVGYTSRRAYMPPGQVHRLFRPPPTFMEG